ncbi:MAG: SpoIVB peptidase [Clostridia bacterium]|nr:MAG: SpoIVB peptidase [Clostridia bacterium]
MFRRPRVVIHLGYILIVFLIISLALAAGVRRIPYEHHVMVGEELPWRAVFPPYVAARLAPSPAQGQAGPEILGLSQGRPVAREPGRASLQLYLFGLLPVKTVQVDVLPPVEVVPGGHSIGVLLENQGVTVVGYAPILEPGGKEAYPARDAGVLLGDVLLAVNGREVRSDEETAGLIDRAGAGGRPVELKVRRGRQVLQLSVPPAKCAQTGRFRIGMYIRDSAAGVGTLTFYDPRRQAYAALGHAVTDSLSQDQAQVEGGRIVQASVEGIQPGHRGQPGEKIGFFAGGKYWGTIDRNTPFGIFGRLTTSLPPAVYNHPVPVAMDYQVHTGPAQILTVVTGTAVEAFDITIDAVISEEKERGRGLVIRITDPRLLVVTGGIVQGMSGSPILQEGRLVGAVTHVFVNDPTRGYGVLAQWMLLETDLFGVKVPDLGCLPVRPGEAEHDYLLPA